MNNFDERDSLSTSSSTSTPSSQKKRLKRSLPKNQSSQKEGSSTRRKKVKTSSKGESTNFPNQNDPQIDNNGTTESSTNTTELNSNQNVEESKDNKDSNIPPRMTHVSLCCDSGCLSCMHDHFSQKKDDMELDNTQNSKTKEDNDTDCKNNSIVVAHATEARNHVTDTSARQVASPAEGTKSVLVEDEMFFVDPEIFSQNSEFFAMAWKGSGLFMKEKDGPLVLEETSLECFKQMEEFFVNGKIEGLENSFDMDNMLEILEAATKYLCPKMTTYCSQVLFTELDIHPPCKSTLQTLLEFSEFNSTFAAHLRAFLRKKSNRNLEYESILAFRLFQATPAANTEDPATYLRRILPFLKLSRRVERLATLFTEDPTVFRKDFALMDALMSCTYLKNKTRLQILLHWRQHDLITEPQFDHLIEKYLKLHAIPEDEIPASMVSKYGLDKPINVQYYAQWAIMSFGEQTAVTSTRHKVRTILTSWLWHVISEDKRFGTTVNRFRIWFRTVTLFDGFLQHKSKHLLGRQNITLRRLQLVGLSCMRFVCRKQGIKMTEQDCVHYTDRAYSAPEFLMTYHEIEETVQAHKINYMLNPLECSGLIEQKYDKIITGPEVLNDPEYSNTKNIIRKTYTKTNANNNNSNNNSNNNAQTQTENNNNTSASNTNNTPSNVSPQPASIPAATNNPPAPVEVNNAAPTVVPPQPTNTNTTSNTSTVNDNAASTSPAPSNAPNDTSQQSPASGEAVNPESLIPPPLINAFTEALAKSSPMFAPNANGPRRPRVRAPPAAAQGANVPPVPGNNNNNATQPPTNTNAATPNNANANRPPMMAPARPPIRIVIPPPPNLNRPQTRSVTANRNAANTNNTRPTPAPVNNNNDITQPQTNNNNNSPPSNNNNNTSPNQSNPNKPPEELSEPEFTTVKYVSALWALHMMAWHSSNRTAKDLSLAGVRVIKVLQITEVEQMAVQLRDLLNQFPLEQKYCLLELLDFMKMRIPDFRNVTSHFEEYEEFGIWWRTFGGFLKLKKNTVFTFYHNTEQKSPVLSIQI